jgi:hypothetical protein
MRQPWPAIFGTTDDGVERQEHVFALDRAVHEWYGQRQVPATDVHARRVGWHQRDGDAEVPLLAEQAVGVEQAEGDAHHRRNRRERDVALGEVEPQPSTSSPSTTCLHTTPVSGMEAASDPARGLVRPKQGISLPLPRAPAASGSSAPRCRT